MHSYLFSDIWVTSFVKSVIFFSASVCFVLFEVTFYLKDRNCLRDKFSRIFAKFAKLNARGRASGSLSYIQIMLFEISEILGKSSLTHMVLTT